MKNFKFFASACHIGHGNWLQPLGGSATDDIVEADVVIFGGGADVDPATYNEEESSVTYTSLRREKEEKKDYGIALELNKKMFGICRGHQLLVALAGGKIIQDVTDHSGHHDVTTFDGLEINTNSIHHQMVSPYNIVDPKEYKILAWCTHKRSAHYIGGKNKKLYLPIQFKEIEAIYLPKINAMGVQYHPEMMYQRNVPNAAIDWTQRTFIKFFENKL